jgi:hypothetical protein
MPIVALIPHASTPAAPVDDVVARVTTTAVGAIEPSFQVRGDLDRLRLPLDPTYHVAPVPDRAPPSGPANEIRNRPSPR